MTQLEHVEHVTVECDNCGKKSEAYTNNATPVNWFKLARIWLRFRPEDTCKPLKDKNILLIDEDEDPDFCSEKCLMTWFTKQVKKIQKGKWWKK